MAIQLFFNAEYRYILIIRKKKTAKRKQTITCRKNREARTPNIKEDFTMAMIGTAFALLAGIAVIAYIESM